MALQLKYSDKHGILHIDMEQTDTADKQTDIKDPKFDSINQRFGQYDLFGGGTQSLFRSRYNSLEEELANTPYAFDRSVLDITIDKDIQDNRYFDHDLFGPKIDLKKDSFTVTQLIHAQDRYYDLSKKGKVRSIAEGFEVKSAPGSARRTSGRGAFKVLPTDVSVGCPENIHATPTSKRKGEKSFAIIAEPSRPNSPRSLPIEIRPGRVSPFKGRGFREETSRHNTPKTSAANSRSNSPPRRTQSLSRIDKMAQMATLPPPGPIHRPPRDFVKENMEEIRELSELNREKNEAEAEKKKVEEEIALLKEMGIIDKKGEIKSVVNSRTNSRSSSPNKYILRSRSNSPSAILLEARSSEFLNKDGGKPVSHRSRVRSVSKSQPQSSNGSPKHSKIPTRQNSVSPTRSSSRQSIDKNLSRNQKYISNSTSSIHESIRIGSTVHDKRASQSTQHLNIGPSNIKNKPPISPGKGGPPPSNKLINSKRLSPIVGTPSKSPLEEPKSKATSGRTPVNSSAVTKGTKPVKATGSTPAASRFNSRQASRAASRDTSPEKRKTSTGVSRTSSITKPATKTPSTRNIQKPPVSNKSEVKKPISRTNSVKNLSRAPSTKALNEKPPLSRQLSKKDVSEKPKQESKKNDEASMFDTNEKIVMKPEETKVEMHATNDKKQEVNKVDANVGDSIEIHDNETQYEKKPAEKEELVIMTKKNVVSMTTAAITSQPLEVVATVTNQLPSALEKAREKAIIERNSSKDSLLGKEDEKETKTPDEAKTEKDDKKTKTKAEKAFEESLKLKPLQPPYNNPQVERVKQKIDSILKEPEISTENILAAAKPKETPKPTTERAKDSIKSQKSDIIETKEKIKKQNEEIAEFKKEASKIVDSNVTPIEEPKKSLDKPKDEVKKTIEPIVTVVSEKKKEIKTDIEKITETLVQGGPEVEVLSSNVSTPGLENIVKSKMADGSSEKSHSNGGFSQSTSTTPKPPPRAHREKEKSPSQETQRTEETPKTNICTRIMGKCRSCCTCYNKAEVDEVEEEREMSEQAAKKPLMQRLNCFKRKVPEEDIEIAAGKGTTIEFESETKRKRKVRDVLCGCCRRDRVADVSEPVAVDVSPPVATSDVVQEAGCCGKRREVERRDSILSEQPTSTCCSAFNRWIVGACRRSSEGSSSRRTSLFSKNKSLSPTLPPEDTRKKLDSSLIEHTSAMRGAIPVLALPLAVICLICNILVPGLGTIFSGLFCLCFGIPRFGLYDGAKHRIGSLVINLLVGCGQLFTVLFCLVGWGWAIWWGVIMVQVSRKYKKLKEETAAAEAEAPPVTNNNHARS